VSADTAVNLLSYAEVVALGLLAVKLGRTRLSRIYRALFVFAIFEAGRAALSLMVAHDTSLYWYIYAATEPITWVLYALMTLEAYQTALSEFPAISSVSRRFVSVSLAGAVVLSVGSLAFGTTNNGPYPILEAFLLVGRVVNASLLIFVICLALILFWFPVPLNRNALVNAATFTFYFGITTGAIFLRNLIGPDMSHAASVAVMCAANCMVIAWMVLLSPQGQQQSVTAGIPRDKERAERLIGQLEALNSTLAGSVRN